MTDEQVKEEAGHNWDLRNCIWCGKPHVKYPINCAKGIAKVVKKYGKQRPHWVTCLVRDANQYLESFRHKFLR